MHLLRKKQWEIIELEIQPCTSADREWVRQKIIGTWGAETIVVHDTIYHPAELPGFIAREGSEVIGLLTYHIQNTACEIVTIDSWHERQGIGSALINALKQIAIHERCRRLWLVATNDNLAALRFYQKRGFTISAVHINAIEKSRQLKPEIPLLGCDGIPIRDEIELELRLGDQGKV